MDEPKLTDDGTGVILAGDVLSYHDAQHVAARLVELADVAWRNGRQQAAERAWSAALNLPGVVECTVDRTWYGKALCRPEPGGWFVLRLNQDRWERMPSWAIVEIPLTKITSGDGNVAHYWRGGTTMVCGADMHSGRPVLNPNKRVCANCTKKLAEK